MIMVGVRIPDIKYWVPVVVRACEEDSIERVKTASTLVRPERIGIRFVHALCHRTSREHNADLERGLRQQERQLCVLPLSIVGIEE